MTLSFFKAQLRSLSTAFIVHWQLPKQLRCCEQLLTADHKRVVGEVSPPPIHRCSHAGNSAATDKGPETRQCDDISDLLQAVHLRSL